ncbi:hypothetical protein AB1A96_16080, partial [Pseudomonas juntendi]|uniref:hypothetical protein n=1 Tax=Pseudomonas juntendi TaxID=2666183 RepID=UPI003454249F
PERNRERSIGHQVDAWNVGMMDPLHFFCLADAFERFPLGVVLRLAGTIFLGLELPVVLRRLAIGI